jgi:hypothetical protein
MRMLIGQTCCPHRWLASTALQLSCMPERFPTWTIKSFHPSTGPPQIHFPDFRQYESAIAGHTGLRSSSRIPWPSYYLFTAFIRFLPIIFATVQKLGIPPPSIDMVLTTSSSLHPIFLKDSLIPEQICLLQLSNPVGAGDHLGNIFSWSRDIFHGTVLECTMVCWFQCANIG